MSHDLAPIVRRASLLSIVWIFLGRTGPVDLAVGAVMAILAAYASLYFMPSAHRPLSPVGSARFALRFISRSVIAGVDVARRVLATPVRVNPGTVSVSCTVPHGSERLLFSSLSSLQPGILPLGDDATRIRLHCLDINADLQTDMAADAEAFMAIYRTPAR